MLANKSFTDRSNGKDPKKNYKEIIKKLEVGVRPESKDFWEELLLGTLAFEASERWDARMVVSHFKLKGHFAPLQRFEYYNMIRMANWKCNLGYFWALQREGREGREKGKMLIRNVLRELGVVEEQLGLMMHSYI